MTSAERALCTCLDDSNCPIHPVAGPDTEPVLRAESPAEVVERLKREQAEAAAMSDDEASNDFASARLQLRRASDALSHPRGAIELTADEIKQACDQAAKAITVLRCLAETVGRK